MPHPSHVIRHLDQRHADYLSESARERRARLADRPNGSSSRLRWADDLATLVAFVVLALLIAAGADAFGPPSVASPLATIVLP